MTDTLGVEEQTELARKLRKQLKNQSKELEKAQALAAEQARQLAFARAGIPDDARGAALATVYDGDLDPTKIRSTYEELFGELGTEDDGLGSAQRIAGAANGGGTSGSQPATEFADALRAARGDNAKVLELIANAPEDAGIKLPDIQ